MNGKNNKIALIPARYDSVRFPGKLMQTLGGKSVILQTYLAVTATGLFRQVAVVTDSPLIYEEIASHGGAVQMSRNNMYAGQTVLQKPLRCIPGPILCLMCRVMSLLHKQHLLKHCSVPWKKTLLLWLPLS